MHLRRAVAACVMLISALAVASDAATEEAQRLEGNRPPQHQHGADDVASTSRFSSHSNSWVTLHHFFYQRAQREAARSAQDWRLGVLDIPEMNSIATLSLPHQRTWRATLDLYLRQVIIRDLLFDRVLLALKHRLACMDSGDEEESPALVSEVVGALRAVMPIYSAHWWREHDGANRRWILQLLAQLANSEEWPATRLTQVYGGRWPAEASWHGVYTAQEPDHITIASTDPANQGDGALEVLFHEASHIGALRGPLQEALAVVYRARRETPPGDLSHAIIFCSAGELTRQRLQESGIQRYEPYAERLGLYKRLLGWNGYRQALAKHWKPCLAGTIDCTTALRRVVEELVH